jgi:hypothetical protein
VVRRGITNVLPGVVIAGLAVLWLGPGAGPALAHEERTVGDYDFVVGFATEPALVGFPNSVQLFVYHGGTDNPLVQHVPESVAVEVIFGDESRVMALEPAFRSPGQYRAFFIPTRPGAYTFHFSGEIKGQVIDEEFTSSATGFDEVQEVSSLEFPAGDSSTTDVGQRLEQEIQRLIERLDAVEAQLGAVGDDSAARSLEDDVADARILGMSGIVVGALGLAVGGAVLLGRRNRRPIP